MGRAEQRHEPLIPDEWFERAQAEMAKRRAGEGSRRRSAQRRFYVLRGIVHCATGHNALRMHGKERKRITYYACSYRISYGDKAASALGHGNWQYVREDRVLDLIDSFFATRIFGAQRIACLRSQPGTLARELDGAAGHQRDALSSRIADVERRIDRQLAAIEAGVDPIVVGERIPGTQARARRSRLPGRFCLGRHEQPGANARWTPR